MPLKSLSVDHVVLKQLRGTHHSLSKQYSISPPPMCCSTSSNSLTDAYAKCGTIDYAAEVFNDMQNSHRDVYSWTAIISGLAMHGRGTDATTMFLQINLVLEMIPDAITFIAVLAACAHSGLVEEGLRVFESMKAEYGIDPELKHYGCMVDLLGRAGLLECAYGFVKMMPMEPGRAILVSLLSACRLHHNAELGEELLKKIELLSGTGGGAPVLLSNMYANENQWNKVIDIRKEMRGGMQEKPPGQSWIEMKDVVCGSWFMILWLETNT